MFKRSLEDISPQTPVDLILMDFQMPNMDGPTATKLIRGLGFKGLVIGVTGNGLPVDIETFIASGANCVLLKPVNKAKIDAAISAELQKKGFLLSAS